MKGEELELLAWFASIAFTATEVCFLLSALKFLDRIARHRRQDDGAVLVALAAVQRAVEGDPLARRRSHELELPLPEGALERLEVLHRNDRFEGGGDLVASAGPDQFFEIDAALLQLGHPALDPLDQAALERARRAAGRSPSRSIHFSCP